MAIGHILVFEERRSLAAPRPLLARPHLDPSIESKQGRALGKPLGSNEVHALAGESALIVCRKELEKKQRRGVIQDCVAEKFEPLVGAVLLCGESRTVAKSAVQQLSILETVTENVFEIRQSIETVAGHGLIVTGDP